MVLRILGTGSQNSLGKHILIVFVSIAIYSYWWQGICSDRKTFVRSLNIRKGLPEIRQTDRKLRKKFAGIRKQFGSIRNHLKGLTFSVILLGNRIISGEYKCFTFARYSPQCESSIIFATPHERPRMLTNTYEYLAIICDHCDWWRIAFVSPFAIYSPLSGEFAANIFFYISKDIRHSVRLALLRYQYGDNPSSMLVIRCNDVTLVDSAWDAGK